jgi:hypothetical protein
VKYVTDGGKLLAVGDGLPQQAEEKGVWDSTTRKSEDAKEKC